MIRKKDMNIPEFKGKKKVKVDRDEEGQLNPYSKL